MHFYAKLTRKMYLFPCNDCNVSAMIFKLSSTFLLVLRIPFDQVCMAWFHYIHIVNVLYSTFLFKPLLNDISRFKCQHNAGYLKALISRAFLRTTTVIMFGSFIILKRIEIDDRDVNMDISVKFVIASNGLVRKRNVIK